MNWRACWFGERRGLHLLASLLLLRVLVSLSATLTWGSLATAGALDFSPASFYPELLPFVSLSAGGKNYFSLFEKLKKK